MKKYVFFIGVLLALELVFLFYCQPHRQHYYSQDNVLCRAWTIHLPGYRTLEYCEQTVDLQDWAGTTMAGLEDEHPDRAAGKTLQALGLYKDCYLKKTPDGHWILYSPPRTLRYFTMYAYYRIWRGKPVELPPLQCVWCNKEGDGKGLYTPTEYGLLCEPCYVRYAANKAQCEGVKL